jgi:hypothetical protein
MKSWLRSLPKGKREILRCPFAMLRASAQNDNKNTQNDGEVFRMIGGEPRVTRTVGSF